MSDNSESDSARHPSCRRPVLRVVESTADDSHPGSGKSLGDVLAGYLALLERSPLSPNTRRAYGRHARGFLAWLALRGDEADEALSVPLARDFAVRDYRRELKDRHLGPSSVNAALSAVDNLYRSLNLGAPKVNRESLPAQAPRALDESELRSVLRAAERAGSARNRAAIALMAHAGLRISEVAGLDVEDIALSARKGTVSVRHGKGDASRVVPLNVEARALLADWLRERPATLSPALFVSGTGEATARLSPRALDRAVRATGRAAGVPLSAHVLRHTFVTRLVRSGADIVLVAELAGHRSLETTRRYALPTAADRQAAVDLVAVDP